MHEDRAMTAPVYLVTVDPVAYAAKPDKMSGEAAAVSDGISAKNARMLGLEDLLREITAGHSWSPITFSGKRREKDFIQAHMLAIDFDGMKDRKTDESIRWVYPADVLSLCRRYELQPCIGYYSYRHSAETPKFRLAFALTVTLVPSKRCRRRLGSLSRSTSSAITLSPARSS